MDNCTLVLDVGKTNKKVLVYDASLSVVEERSAKIGEIVSDGMKCENIHGIADFFLECAGGFSRRHGIRGVAVSAHGATIGGIDVDGSVMPVISYTNDPGESLHEEFYAEFGSPGELKKTTGTPNFADFLNPAKTLYYLKTRKPEQFRRMRRVLFYPQLFTYLLTGKFCAEPSSAGNHNYLWDFSSMGWSGVAAGLGISGLLPGRLIAPWEPAGAILPEIAGRTGLPAGCVVAGGIHDSNAALLPYILAGEKDFLLNSTGTWCVVMKPEDRFLFSDDELGRTIFFNLSPFGKPVKTAIFMGGFEYEWYMKALAPDNDYSPPAFDIAAYREIIARADSFIIPSVTPGFGLFPGSAARIITGGTTPDAKSLRSCADRDRVYRLLNLSLAVQSLVAFEYAGLGDGTVVYVEGGFRKNSDYLSLLAALCPKSEIRVSDFREASAFGAAVCASIAAGTLSMDDTRKIITPEYRSIPRAPLGDTGKYVRRFIDLADAGS
jgi:L-fuculokinase